MDPTRSPDRALIHERKLARQMGCMAGFFQLFSRHHLLTGRRIHSSRSLPSSPAPGSSPPSGRSEASLSKENHPCHSLESRTSSPERVALRPWKLREAPRLSLDSRAVVDGKGKLRPRDIRKTRSSAPSDEQSAISEKTESEKHRRNPSVVARLMGLDALPISGGGGGDADSYHSELRRSASESRVPRYSPNFRFVDTASFEKKTTPEPVARRPEAKKTEPPPVQRRNYLDAGDFFPEPKKPGYLFGEIDKRLKKRGIDEPERDLETLKQILESVQLKGLLHSDSSSDQRISARRNIIYDGNSRISSGSPIVVMKPNAKSSRQPFGEPSSPPSRSMPQRRNATTSSESTPAARRERLVYRNDKRNRAPMSPEGPPARRRFSNTAEIQKTPQSQSRISTVNSPELSTNRVGPGPGPGPLTVHSSANRRPVVPADSTNKYSVSPSEDDTATTVSESSVSSSQFDSERPRSEEYRNGRELLERCDKLLSSIVAFTAAAEHQPSPVSVLDSSPYLGGGECSQSPEVKRSIDFKDWEEEDQWSASTPTGSSSHGDEEAEYEDEDFAYVSRILDTSDNGYLDTSADVFAILEKFHYASVSSDAGRLHRRLVFDTVAEILERRIHLLPWDALARVGSIISRAADGGGVAFLRQVWAEFRRTREQAPADDINDDTCEAIMKDMDGDHLGGGVWGLHQAIEFSNAALFIERQIFKDLVAEATRELADDVAGEWRPIPRRKLVF